METIDRDSVQHILQSFTDKHVYIHFEITNGAYAGYRHGKFHSVGGYVRNAKIFAKQAKITGEDPYRVGVKTDDGWVFAEGITVYEHTENKSLYLYGFDENGKLSVALQLSLVPF